MRFQVVLTVAAWLVALAPVRAQVTYTVSSSMDIYQAGGYQDGTGAAPPLDYPLSAGTQTVTFPDVSGEWTCQYNLAYYTADGTTLPGNCLSGGRDIVAGGETLSEYEATDFAGALVGVFLGDQPPAVRPAALRFYTSDSSSGGIPTNFPALRPELGQVFFIGDGKTGKGTGGVQTFFVPPLATHLYLGYADACVGSPQPACFGDNAGAIIVKISSQLLPGLCSTGQTQATAEGCTDQLVVPSQPGSVINQDGNWSVAYAPFSSDALNDPCSLSNYTPASVDPPFSAWLPNAVSQASEWINPAGGSIGADPGWYVYRVRFPIPRPTSGAGSNSVLTINGRLTSDNFTSGIYLRSPASSQRCSLVSNQPFPVNPAQSDYLDFRNWWPFSFTNTEPVLPGSDAFVYFVVLNPVHSGPIFMDSPTGLRVEFFASSIRKPYP